MGLKEFLPFLKEEKEKEEKKITEEEELKILKEKIKIYEKILNRYKEFIEKQEAKTIADMKNLIKTSDEAITHKKEEIIEKMRPYIFEQHFLEAADAAHRFVNSLSTNILPIDFWLTPSEVIELGGGDPMDKAVFLCSLLIALENSESYIIVGTNKGIKVAVEFKFKEDWYLFDPTSNQKIKGEKDKIINEWFGEAKRIYEFNDREYNLIKGEE